MMAATAATKRGRRRRKRSVLPPPPPSPPPAAAEPRRTLRPRRHRPLLLGDFANFDDYLVDDEELVEGHGGCGDEEQERTWRKLKLVRRAPRSPVGRRGEEGATARARRFGSPQPTVGEFGHRREAPVRPDEASSSSAASSSSYADAEENEEEVKPPKKRRFDGSDDARGSDEEERRENVVPRRKVSIPGLSTSSMAGTPLPERKLLEAILDKLQKKDTYGAFAQPVDPEELPDYHEVIEHPMDYGTVRKKLAGNVYHSLEQFEDDVFLICNNAMQYNAPDTVYFRQARSMQDIGRKEFEKLRSESDSRTEERIRSRSPERKPLQKFLPKIVQEPLGSEISSAATLTSAGDACTLLSAPPVTSVGPDPPAAVSGIADGSSSLGDSKTEKLDELSVKDSPSKFGRKTFIVDENRRGTYNMSEQQPSIESDLVLDIFEGETRQLVAVGAEVEYSYARSLARFAASLGPIGWKIASQKIESALPTGVKFGPGWVGEYEPLPTPILCLEKHHQQQLYAESSMQLEMGLKKHIDNFGGSTNRLNVCNDKRSAELSQLNMRNSSRASNRVKDGNGHSRDTEPVQRQFSNTPETPLRVASTKLQRQREQVAINFEQANSKTLTQVGFCRSSSLDSPVANKPTKKSDTIPFDNKCMHSEIQKQTGALKAKPEASKPCSAADGLGRNISETSNERVLGTFSSDSMSNTASFNSKHQPGMLGKWRTPGTHEQGIIENSKIMGISNKVNQLNDSNMVTDSPRPFPPSVPPAGRENPNNASFVAARAWMSVGASSQRQPPADYVNISNRQTGPSSSYGSWTTPNSSPRNIEDSKILPVSQSSRQPVQVVGHETPVQNKGLVIFPQIVPTELSRFHSPSPWQGLVPQMPKHNKICPPDLNISFQPPSSPVPQSSSILMDSQQPDLALQL